MAFAFFSSCSKKNAIDASDYVGNLYRNEKGEGLGYWRWDVEFIDETHAMFSRSFGSSSGDTLRTATPYTYVFNPANNLFTFNSSPIPPSLGGGTPVMTFTLNSDALIYMNGNTPTANVLHRVLR